MSLPQRQDNGLPGHIEGWTSQPPAPVPIRLGAVTSPPRNMHVVDLSPLTEVPAYLDEETELNFPRTPAGSYYVIVTPRDVTIATALREGEDWTASVAGEGRGAIPAQADDVGTSCAVAHVDGEHNVFYTEALAELSVSPRVVAVFQAVEPRTIVGVDFSGEAPPIHAS